MLKFIGALVVNAGAVILNGFVFSILWGWFVCTTFHVQPLAVPAAVGIVMLAGFLTKQINRADEEREDARKYNMTIAIAKPVAFLISGYIVHLFM